MKKKFSVLVSSLMVCVFACNASFGNLLVSVRSAEGRDLVADPLNEGEDHLLHLYVQTLSLPYTDSGGVIRNSMRWNGGDVLLNSGCDATFGLADNGAQTNARGMIIPAGGPNDGFIPFPQFGSTSIFFTGGPKEDITIPIGQSVAFAQILLRAGPTGGSVDLSGALMVNNLFFNIQTQTAALRYGYDCIPEPTSSALVGLATCVLWVRRRVR